jgi:anti-sigma regulatory factor (Ser/Thr protein kinase)
MAENRAFKFRSRPEAVSAARRALDGLDAVLDAAVFYDASLCVSELVTNAVLHSEIGPEEELNLEVRVDEDGCLRVTVTDSGRGFEPQTPTTGSESGWGLFIVDRLSHRWGFEHKGAGTCVWFEMGTDGRGRETVDDHEAGVRTDEVEAAVESPDRGRRRGPKARLRLGSQAPA